MEDQNTPSTVNVKPNIKGNVPRADADFANVVNEVATRWTATTSITLLWTTSAAFLTKASAFNTELSKRNDIGSSRPQITDRLKELDVTIDNAVPYVKSYLLEMFKKSSKSYYPSFGIEHKSNKYIIPRDRNNRSEALRLIIKGIEDNGLGAKEFGTTFWTEIKTEYDSLLGKATSTDGTVSIKVSTKNELKKELKKVLNSLILVIKGNYPDTYKSELRSWGFQKEKY
jgi:hypothetical protein